MKQNYITKIFFTLAISLLSYSVFAQTDYTYTLIDNGGYSYTISAVPTTTTSNFATSVQSYGFTIIIPDGVTLTVSSSLGNGASDTFFDGNNVGDPSIDGYLITETLSAPIDLSAPSANVSTPMVTIQVNGSPTSGTISILANDDPLAQAVNPLQSFLTADTTDDGSVNYSNRVNSASGVSGTSSHSFSTLGVTTNTLEQIKIFPNPTNGIINIAGLDNEVVKASVYSINGQLVLTKSSNLDTINIADVAPGVYFLNIETTTANKVVKLVKQ